MKELLDSRKFCEILYLRLQYFLFLIKMPLRLDYNFNTLIFINAFEYQDF